MIKQDLLWRCRAPSVGHAVCVCQRYTAVNPTCDFLCFQDSRKVHVPLHCCLSLAPCCCPPACLPCQPPVAHIPSHHTGLARDVDHVMTTAELGKIFQERGIKLNELPESPFDDLIGEGTGGASLFGTTGGVMEAALRTVCEQVGRSGDCQLLRGAGGGESCWGGVQDCNGCTGLQTQLSMHPVAHTCSICIRVSMCLVHCVVTPVHSNLWGLSPLTPQFWLCLCVRPTLLTKRLLLCHSLPSLGTVSR